MQWYLEVLKKYAVFSGRARRKEYWMFVLFNIIVSFVVGFVAAIISVDILPLVYSLAILLPAIAVSVRRMHDIGRSGWWIIVPIVGFVFLFFDSQPEENEYGPNPKLA